jgi:hypothetical protein
VNSKPFDPFDKLRASRLPGTMPGTGRTLRAVSGELLKSLKPFKSFKAWKSSIIEVRSRRSEISFSPDL